MRARLRVLIALLILTTVASPVLAQAEVPAAAAPAAGGLVGLCAMIDAKIKECKKKICECPLGQMLTAATKVFNLYGGGLLCPSCCPEVKEDDLKKASNTPQGACARIRKEEEEAPDRRAAVRCLAYADCNWYPEAEAALITALRTDRNECVRYEAASVLGSGCCCTRKIIEALAISASGSKKDGNPPENSLRVKAAAYISLQHCLNCYVQVEELNPLEQPEKPERLPDPKVLPPGTTAFEPIQPTVALRPVPVTVDPLIAEARSVLAESKVHAVEPSPIMTTGHRSLYDAFVRASNPPSKPAAAAGSPSVEPPMQPKPQPRSVFEWFAGRKTVAPPPPVAEPGSGPDSPRPPEPGPLPDMGPPTTAYPANVPQP